MKGLDLKIKVVGNGYRIKMAAAEFVAQDTHQLCAVIAGIYKDRDSLEPDYGALDVGSFFPEDFGKKTNFTLEYYDFHEPKENEEALGYYSCKNCGQIVNKQILQTHINLCLPS